MLKEEDEMQIFRSILQVVVALCLLNVWLIRYRRSTAYRGGNARSMREEFELYGLPTWSIYVIGTMKVGAALCLLAGLWLPMLVLPSAILICILMIGALAMHLKVGDSALKSLPALSILVLSIGIAVLGRL